MTPELLIALGTVTVSLLTLMGGSLKWVWDKLEARRMETESRLQKEMKECETERLALTIRVAHLEERERDALRQVAELQAEVNRLKTQVREATTRV